MGDKGGEGESLERVREAERWERSAKLTQSFKLCRHGAEQGGQLPVAEVFRSLLLAHDDNVTEDEDRSAVALEVWA